MKGLCCGRLLNTDGLCSGCVMSVSFCTCDPLTKPTPYQKRIAAHKPDVFCEYCDEVMKEFSKDMTTQNKRGACGCECYHCANYCQGFWKPPEKRKRNTTTQKQGVRELLADAIATDSHGEMIINWVAALKKADAIIELINREIKDNTVGKHEDHSLKGCYACMVNEFADDLCARLKGEKV